MDNTSNVVDIDWLANPIREAYDGSPAEIALAVLEAIRSAGYVVVPVEPTKAMVKAGEEAYEPTFEYGIDSEDTALVYSAMIAAAEGVE